MKINYWILLTILALFFIQACQKESSKEIGITFVDGEEVYNNEEDADRQDESVVKLNDFKDLKPRIINISPLKGPQEGNNLLTISFINLSEDIKIFIGSNPLEIVKFDPQKGLITAKVPKNTSKSFKLPLRIKDSKLGETVFDDYTYLTGIEIKDISPSIGSIAGGYKVTVTGAKFYSELKAYVENVPVDSLEVVDSKTVKLVMPPGSMGKSFIIFENPDTSKASISFYYKESSPEIVNVTPASPFMDKNAEIELMGQDFMPDSEVYFDEVKLNPENIDYIDPTKLKVKVPLNIKDLSSIKVQNYDGNSHLLPNCFRPQWFVFEKLGSYSFENNNNYDLSKGIGSELSITVNENTTSFGILVDSKEGEDFDIFSLKTPSLKNLITSAAGEDQPVGRSNAKNEGQTSLMTIFPLNFTTFNPFFPFELGNYRFKIQNLGIASDADIYIFKKVDRDLSKGRLFFNFYLIGDELIETGQDKESSLNVIKTISEEVSAIYKQIGIEIGGYKVYEILDPKTDDSPSVINFKDSDENHNNQLDELDRLFENSSTAENLGINLFFVRDIVDTNGNNVAIGLSSDIPGPILLNGTKHSGVVIAAFDKLSRVSLTDIDIIVTTIAHESAHFLGLFHTSEENGTLHDPVMDTPECTLTEDIDQDGKISYSHCFNHGNDNLMFPFIDAHGRNRKLTSEQGKIMNLNPGVN